MEKKKRDERRFAKKLVRLAKYLEVKGMNGSEVSSMLRKAYDSESLLISKEKKHYQSESSE